MFYLQVAAALGLTLAVISVSILLWLHHQVTWEVIATTAIIPTIATPVSFVLAWVILKKNIKAAKAISFETAIQNAPTAFAFLVISYREPVVGEMAPPLIIAGLFGLFVEIIAVIVYQLAKLRVFRQKMFPENVEEVEKVDIEAEEMEKIETVPEISEKVSEVVA